MVRSGAERGVVCLFLQTCLSSAVDAFAQPIFADCLVMTLLGVVLAVGICCVGLESVEPMNNGTCSQLITRDSKFRPPRQYTLLSAEERGNTPTNDWLCYYTRIL